MFTFKELYNISILSYQKTDKYDKEEPVLFLDRANFSSIVPNFENQNTGKTNNGSVYWDYSQDTSFKISKGVVNTKELKIFNQNLNIQDNTEKIQVVKREVLKTNELFQITLSEIPTGTIEDLYIGDINKTITKKIEKNFYQNIFCYNSSMEKIIPISQNEKIITFEEEGVDIIVYYAFEKNVKDTVYTFEKGDTMFFKIHAEIVHMDEENGTKNSCIVEFPKVLIRPNLSYQLGMDNNFTSYDFDFISLPDEIKGKKYSCKMTFIEGDTIEPYE